MIRALISFFLIYLTMMACWLGVQNTYQRCFVGFGRFLFSGFAPSSMPAFESHDKPHDSADTTIHVFHRPTSGTFELGLNSWEIGYFPSAVIIGLILATPAPWLRRLRNLLFGLTLVYVFVSLRLLVLIAFWANRDITGVTGDPTTWQKTIATAVHFIGVSFSLSTIVPIIVWGFLCIRREHLKLIIGDSGSSGESE